MWTLHSGGRITTLSIAMGLILTVHSHAQAQTTVNEQLRILRLEATPIGALPQIALPMPASRNNNYLGVRLQAAQRRGRGTAADLKAVAAGIDLQWRGGSLWGITAGYQQRDCAEGTVGCGGHMLFGARARLNFLTGGPGLGGMFNDYSATTTVGTELGFGYAPRVLPGLNACTFDVGVPLSLSLLQRVRLVPFITPSFVWDINCSRTGPKTGVSFLTSLGVGLQQIGLRGLDAYVGLQKIFHGGTGHHVGITVSYIHIK
jgi:hypothetical protein